MLPPWRLNDLYDVSKDEEQRYQNYPPRAIGFRGEPLYDACENQCPTQLDSLIKVECGSAANGQSLFFRYVARADV
jgi:hypothetical protein